MENAQGLYAQLIALGRLDGVSNAIALKRIGLLVDLSSDLGREDGTMLALDWSTVLATRKLKGAQRAILEYFVANAWHNGQLMYHQSADAAWRWEQLEFLQQIYHLRAAIRVSGFDKLSALRRCQILTKHIDAAWADQLAYSVQRQDFENKTVHVLRLARASLIDLALGMHREELRRSEHEKDGIKAPMTLPPMDDEWKQ